MMRHDPAHENTPHPDPENCAVGFAESRCPACTHHLAMQSLEVPCHDDDPPMSHPGVDVWRSIDGNPWEHITGPIAQARIVPTRTLLAYVVSVLVAAALSAVANILERVFPSAR